MIKLIKTLITVAAVAGFDETTLRAGKAGTKKYVQGAFTEQYTLLFLGERTLESFREFGILEDFAGVAVTDRYVNYWHASWKNLAGRQACLAHLIRDTGLGAIPADIREPLVTEFRRAVRVGLSRVPRVPGPKNSTRQHPGRDLLEFCRDRQDDVLRFTTDTRIWPTNDLASHCTSCGGWEVRGLAGRSGGCRAGGFSVAGGSDILPWRAGAPGFAVGVAAA